MGEEPREARLTLGSKSYSIETALDRESFSQIEAICQNLYRRLDPRSEHEKRLVLGWMMMAYKLQQTEQKLSLLLKEHQFPAKEGGNH